jgi:hypothetical protein
MTTPERIKSVFDILESVKMPKELRYRLKEKVRTAMQDGAYFGGVVVKYRKVLRGSNKYTGVLHLWRLVAAGGIVPLTIKTSYTEQDDAQ